MFCFQGFLIAIGAIVMATFSTGIDSQSFQVNYFFQSIFRNKLFLFFNNFIRLEHKKGREKQQDFGTNKSFF